MMTGQENSDNNTVATLDQETKNDKSTATTLNQANINATNNTAEPAQQTRRLAKLEAAGTESSTNPYSKDPNAYLTLQLQCGRCGGSMGSYPIEVLKLSLRCYGTVDENIELEGCCYPNEPLCSCPVMTIPDADAESEPDL